MENTTYIIRDIWRNGEVQTYEFKGKALAIRSAENIWIKYSPVLRLKHKRFYVEDSNGKLVKSLFDHKNLNWGD